MTPTDSQTEQQTHKYRPRVDELESLKQELEVPKRPGDPAPIIGRVLEAAGDLLRRSRSTPCDAALIDKVLGLVPQSALSSWGDGVQVEEVRKKLSRASAEAVEAALPDGEDDGVAMAGWAMQDLMARDRLESALIALERLGSKGRVDATKLHQRLRGALAPVDAAARGSVASLTALNTQRRAEAALLDTECKSRAWWLTERSGLEDDALVKVLGGATSGTLNPVERDVERTVKTKRPRSVSFDELFRFDLGLASPAEAAVIRSQAERDPELKLMLTAMAEGDRAIDEATQGEPTFMHVPVGQPVEQRTPPEVIEERAEFKVLLFRTKQRVQVVVQPRRPDRFAAAALYLDTDRNRALPSAPGDHGLHFDVGTPEQCAGHGARVVVKLTDGQPVTCELKL